MKKKKKNIIIGYKLNDLILGILTLIFSIFMLIKMDYSESNRTWILLVLLAIGSISILWKFINPNNKFVGKNTAEAKEFEIEQLKKELDNYKILEFNEFGLKVNIEGKESQLNWTDIRKVYLFRKKLFNEEEFYLDIWVDRGNSKSFGICETSEKWEIFTKKLTEKFSEINKEWKNLYLNLDVNKKGIILYERN